MKGTLKGRKEKGILLLAFLLSAALFMTGCGGSSRSTEGEMAVAEETMAAVSMDSGAAMPRAGSMASMGGSGGSALLGEDEAGNLLQMIQALSYTQNFDASDWVAGSGECTITIPAATHGMTGDTVTCQAYALVSGAYLPSVWAALETYATVGSNGDIVLHYPSTTGYAGKNSEAVAS